VFLWDVETGEKVKEFNVQGLLKSVEFAIGSRQFFVIANSGLGATSNTLKVYDTNRVLEVKEPQGQVLMNLSSEKLTVATWGFLNKAVYAATERGNLYHLDATTEGEPVNKVSLHERDITSVNFSKDYTLLITSSKDGFCKILNPETLEVLKAFNGARPINRAIFSPLILTGEKYHAICAGGQEARDVTTTKAEVSTK
jgi:WD40 repeat protein